jgi:cyclic-di-GMP-binding biofilm dispersal mediator protein
MTELRNQRFLVIGASGGLGSALVGALNEKGAEVIAIAKSGPFGLDITNEDARRQLSELVVAHDGIDGIIIASGLVGFGIHGTLNSAEVAQLIVAPLQVLNDLVPHIREGGNITVITGAVVDFATLGMAAYTAAKAGLSASCAVLRRELRSRKISVLDARPPHTETGLATRPLYGQAPAMKEGLSPASVAERIIAGIEAGETEIPPALFS